MAGKRHNQSERHRLARATRGLPLERAAAKAGVAPATMQRWRAEAGVVAGASSSTGSDAPAWREELRQHVHAADPPVPQPRSASEILGSCLDLKQARRFLKLSEQQVRQRLVDGDLLGVVGRRTVWFPKWQFDLRTKAVRPAVKCVIDAFSEHIDEIDSLVIASWATSRQPEDLAGETPAQWIESDKATARVTEAAHRAAVRLAQ